MSNSIDDKLAALFEEARRAMADFQQKFIDSGIIETDEYTADLAESIKSRAAKFHDDLKKIDHNGYDTHLIDEDEDD